MDSNAALYGVGRGNAYVIQGNPGIGLLQDMQKKTALAQAQAQKQADLENAQNAASLQKLDYSKTREADQPQFISDYGDIQGTFNKLRTTTDPTQRIILNNQLQTQQKDFLHKAALSQMALENHKNLRQFALNHSNDIRDGYTGDLDNADKVSTFSNDYQPALDKLNTNPLITPFDQAAYEKKVLPTALTPVSDYGTLKTTKLANGATMTQQENGSDVDLNKLKTQLHNDYQLNNKSGIKQYINGKVQANGSDANAEIDKYAQDIYNRSQPNYGSELIAPKGHIVEPQKPDKFYEHAMWRLDHPTASQQAANAPTYFDDLSERMRTGVPGSGEEFSQNLAQNPDYKKGLKIDDTNPKAVRITVPAKYKFDPKQVETDDNGKPIPNSGRVVVKPAYTAVLDKTDPNQWTAGFSRIYKDVTGDQNANPTKAMTIYGKGKVPGGLSKFTAPTAGANPVNKHKKAASDYGL
jgi:hypothetical protein